MNDLALHCLKRSRILLKESRSWQFRSISASWPDLDVSLPKNQMKRTIQLTLSGLLLFQSVGSPVLAADDIFEVQQFEEPSSNSQNHQADSTFSSASDSSDSKMSGSQITVQENTQQEDKLQNPASSSDRPSGEDHSMSSRMETQNEAQTVSSSLSPVFRLYNPNSGEHFYTLSEAERDTLMRLTWKYEGVNWYINQSEDGAPLFRLYNPNTGDHHYTLDSNERDSLVNAGWKDEGIAWSTDPKETTCVYRLYNPNEKRAGTHHYTTDAGEYETLARLGWRPEGIAFFALPPAELKTTTFNGQTGTVYEKADGTYATGLQFIGSNLYYFDPDTGCMMTDLLLDHPQIQKKYYFGLDGKACQGMVSVHGQTRVFDQNYQMLTSCTYVSRNGTAFFLDGQGQIDLGVQRIGSVILTPGSDGTIQKSAFTSVYRYMQTDPRWGDVIFTNISFSQLGCVPTVMSCILNTLTPASTTPLELGYALQAAGYLSGDVFGSKPLGTVTDGIPWLAEKYGLVCHSYMTLEESRAILKAGGMISLTAGPGLFASTSIDHQILVYGYDENGMVYVHDPYDSSRSGLYSLEIVYAQKSAYSEADEAGSVFGIENPSVKGRYDF